MSDETGKCSAGVWPLRVVLSLMVLRLCVGWHFFSEGTKKIAYNPTTKDWRIAFSAEGFLRGAVGPLAPFYHGQLPGFHNWQQLLAAPRQYVPAQPPETKPYQAWMDQITSDWKKIHGRYAKTPGLTEEQVGAAVTKLEAREKQLAEFLAGEEESIAEIQHELWRLEQWESDPGASDIPFQQERIAEKRAETRSSVMALVAQVRGIQDGYFSDLRKIVPPDQRDAVRVEASLVDAKQRNLERMNLAVTCLVTGIGLLLLLGLFTRLAAVCGCAFLLMVMSTQPPWVAGANTSVFYYQVVEIAALAVLFATAAGRFGGLDFFFSKCCGGKKS